MQCGFSDARIQRLTRRRCVDAEVFSLAAAFNRYGVRLRRTSEESGPTADESIDSFTFEYYKNVEETSTDTLTYITLQRRFIIIGLAILQWRYINREQKLLSRPMEIDREANVC